jgi:type 2 lantibiotic biosynthesis protein LanM
MTPEKNAGDFDESLGCLISGAVGDLATRLVSIAGLTEGERALIARGAEAGLIRLLHDKLNRLLLLELNAARVNGELTGETSQERWKNFITSASTLDFWRSLSRHYPKLLPRVEAMVHNRCASILDFAVRFAGDRALLDAFHGGPLGELRGLTLSAGDSHRGGKAVIVVRCLHGSVVYKPRSLAIDVELGRFVRAVLGCDARHRHIGVPSALDRGVYGWAEFIEHRHVEDEADLPDFYSGIGRWLALMRLLGGCDLHAENLIAQGSVPVIIDCETLFAPRLQPVASGMGRAFDIASERISGSVMNIGLLPSRGSGLGWRGVDVSGVGALPAQQPMVPSPRMVEPGSDEARMGMVMTATRPAQNHPSKQPSLDAHWPMILQGFDDMTIALQQLDSSGQLAPLLQGFAECPIRVVPRSTEAYAELGRMLWHPVSLHKQDEAVRLAQELLAKMAEHRALAPSDEAVISAEVADLLEGDIPFFATTPGHGQLCGPRGTSWLSPENLVTASLQHWRNANWTLEQEVIKSTLLSAYESDVWSEPVGRLRTSMPRLDDLEARRRRQAARMVELLMSSSIRGEDGSVAWIASVLGPTGRTVQPLGQDLYGGISGIALLVAAYRRERLAGRADAVPGLDDLLSGLVQVMRLAETQSFLRRGRAKQPRPPALGGYIGLGSQIWTWLMLERWDVVQGEGLEHAYRLAELVPEAAAADSIGDLLSGTAGAIVPLIVLAKASGRASYLDMAIELGDRLRGSARQEDGAIYWAQERWPRGMGGFAHGVTGVAWAMSRLAAASGLSRFAETSVAAMAFEERLYDARSKNWSDLRMLGGPTAPAAWCHGAVGIGLALADLHPELDTPQLRERFGAAAETAWRSGVGLNHGICHGDMGAWELLELSIRSGLGPAGLDRETLLAAILTSLEQHGPVCGMAGKDYTPGLMGGLSGIAYQLLRAHPDNEIPSVMVIG